MTGAVLDDRRAGPDDAALRETIRQRVEAAGTSFYWAMRLLPRRAAARHVRGLCLLPRSRRHRRRRRGRAGAQETRARRVARRDRRDLCRPAATPRRPRAAASRSRVMRCDREDFHAVIDGMEMDAATDIRAPDLATLDLYCGRVAGAVGHLSVHVFGDPSAGRACGRRFARAGVAADQHPARPRRRRAARPALSAARNPRPRTASAAPSRARCCATRRCRRSAATSPAIAEAHFTEAELAMARCSRRAMRPAAVMARVLPRDARRSVALGVARPRAAGQPVEAEETVAGAAPRAGMTAGMTVGAARPGACRRSRSRRARRGGRACRRGLSGRAVRVWARMPAGAAAPFSMPSSAAASTTATTCCCPATRAALAYLDADRRARHASRPGRGGDSRSSISRPASAGRCGRTRGVGAVVDLQRRAGGSREPRARDYLAALRLRRAAPADSVATVLLAGIARCSAGCGSRSRSRR